MPEGPEVRRSADQIERAVANKPISCIFEHPVSKNGRKRFRGTTLTGVDTYGKAFVLNFSNEQSIYVHLQLYGRWKTGRLSSHKPSRRSLRLRLETETHYAELYSATDIEVLATKDVLKHKFIKKLGPDLLKQGYVASHISRRLNKKVLQDERWVPYCWINLYLVGWATTSVRKCCSVQGLCTPENLGFSVKKNVHY